MHLPNATNHEQGFTLVELLVVIGIIAILTAIAVPMFLSQRKKAEDAVLKSDLRSAAIAVTEAYEDMSPLDIHALFNDNYTVSVFGKSAVHEMPNPAIWNSKIPAVPKITVSDNTVLGVTVFPQANVTWREHKKGEFCLYAASHTSNFDYLSGNGPGAYHYDRNLYYDANLGGVRTIGEISAAYKSGQRVSCSGMAKSYIAARGEN